jgi:hypothetical protein
MLQENNRNKDGESKILDLESLNTEYKNLLIEYKQAVANYVDYLKQEHEQPCKNFISTSKNIDQKCYNEIWKQAGCTTATPVKANNVWIKSKTLNGLIEDSFFWATESDNKHRVGCYGKNYKAAKLNTSKSPNYNTNQLELASIKGAAYWGKSGLSQKTTSKLEECKASCASTPGCSGATFNPDKNMCFLRSGDSEIVGGLPNDYAIVPKGKQLLEITQKINERLTQVNEEIQNKTPAIESEYDLQLEERSYKNKELMEQYGLLTTERNNIKKMLDEYQTLDEQQIDGDLNIYQNYYSFILLIMLAILFIYILYMFSGTGLSTTSTTRPFIQSGGLYKK